MLIRFFPLDFDYKLKDNKVYLYLYSKTEDGTKICVIQQHQPYFYARCKIINEPDFEKRLQNFTLETNDGRAEIISWEKVEKELLGKKELFYKIYTNYPKAVPPLSKELESWGAECYERDILFIHRYLRDKGITPMGAVEAEGNFIADKELRIPIFVAEEVKQVSKEPVQNLKILALDIETYATKREVNPQRNPILMVGLYGKDGQGIEFKKVITWKGFPHDHDYIETCRDEKQMLERFREIILEYRPDIITGYFTDGFDFPYIEKRAEIQKVTMNLGLDFSRIITGSKGFQEKETKIKGILHLDIFKFIRNIFGKDLKTDSLSLDAVAEELLGHKKHVVNLDRLGEVWDFHPEELPEFCAYNLHDCFLAQELCRKLLPDMIEFTKLIGLPTFDIIRMRFSRLVENYIMKRAMEYNIIAPNKPADPELEERREKSIEGAFVFEPTPGLYKDMIVFDFRSLYPTIITAHNIGPEGFRCDCCQGKVAVPEKEDYWFCTREKKFLPQVLEQLITLRANLKKLIKEEQRKDNDTKMLEARSYALKILANSFYGYLGFYGARWYSIESAASTTAYARNYIKKTIVQAQESGFEVIYADTDSCFLLLGEKTLAKAMEFMNDINKDLPGQMELEFQGYYPRGIFVAQKGSEHGAKKKYALMSEKGKVKITGFETVRRNWSLIAKEVQQQVLRLVLSDKTEEAVQYVRTTVAELKQGQVLNAKLIIKTQITRELGSYASSGPHVTVARRLQEKGENIAPGTIIEYVITKGSGLVRDRAQSPEEVADGNYDAEYYIHHQLLPAVNSIFLVLGYAEDELFSESSQMGLGKFM